MIRAFSTTDKIYNTNGDAVIAATKARVKNEDNGDFILELICGSEYNDYIQANNIIVAPTPQGDQAFRVRQVEKRGNRIEAKCYHVFYDAENYLIADSYAYNMTAKQALEHFNAATDNTSPLTVDSDITSINNLRIVRGSLAEAVVSVIERWGGHLVRDNYNIALKGVIGRDNGITIEYKKNLKELTASYDWGGVITKLLPVGKDGILIDGLYVSSATQYDIPFTKTVSFEQEIEREDYASDEAYITALKADLRAQAQRYVNLACVPNINYTLKGNPEKVTDIGDIIEVKDTRIGVNVLTKVIAYEYDAITKKYVNLEFGNFTPKLSSLMSDIKAETSLQIASATSNINIEVNSINNNITELNTIVNNLNQNKQNKLIAGQNITITSNNVISATSERGIDVLYGEEEPISDVGKDKDIYVKLKPSLTPQNLEFSTNSIYQQVSLSRDVDLLYNIVLGGTSSVDLDEYVAYKIKGLKEGKTYTFSFDGKMSDGCQFYDGWISGGELTGQSIVGITFQKTAEYYNDMPAYPNEYNAEYRYMSFYRDDSSHHYTNTFVATSDTMYMIAEFNGVKDGTYRTMTLSNLSIREYEIEKVFFKYENDWMKAGVTANPTNRATESLTKIKINGVVYSIEGGGGSGGIEAYYDSITPTSSLGSDGDLYLQTDNSFCAFNGKDTSNAWVNFLHYTADMSDAVSVTVKLKSGSGGTVLTKTINISDFVVNPYSSDPDWDGCDRDAVVPDTNSRVYLGYSTQNPTYITAFTGTGTLLTLYKVIINTQNASRIKDFFGKTNGEWLKYNPYESLIDYSL